MKTAIQELIDIVEMDYNNGVEISMRVFHGMLTKALEKEKQQIIDAYEAEWPQYLTTKGAKYFTMCYENKDTSCHILCE
jgi:hypothetical protein